MSVIYATDQADTQIFQDVTHSDIISYRNATVSTTVSPAGGYGGATGWAAGDTYGPNAHNFELSEVGMDVAHQNTWVGFGVNDTRYVNVTGGAGNDLFFAGAGADFFSGGGAGDLVLGDEVTYAFSPVGVTAYLQYTGTSQYNAQDPLLGGSGVDRWTNIETLEGSSHDDILYSGDDGKDHQLLGDPSEGYSSTSQVGNDELHGRFSNNATLQPNSTATDNFIPEGGEDKIYLGAGINWIDYENFPINQNHDGLTVDMLDANASTGDAHNDTYYEQNGNLITASSTVSVNLAGSDGRDILWGTNGANTISGGPRGDSTIATNYNSTSPDEIHGRGGDDVLLGMDGNDVMYGDAGNDVLKGDGGQDTLYGGDGNDLIEGISGGDVMYGGSGADTFRYWFFSDSVSSGYDIIGDFSGAGGDGDKIDLHTKLQGVTAVSLVTSGSGTFLFSNQGPDGNTLQIGSVNTIQGTDLDLAPGASLTMIGDGAHNILVGSANNDRILGGNGDDWLRGGGGADVFIYGAASESTVSNPDSILDFSSGNDKLDVSSLHLSQSNVGWAYSNGSTFVFLDTNNDQQNDMLIQLNGTPSITYSDFVF